MTFESVNPATGESVARYETWDAPRLEAALTRAAAAAPAWAARPIAERAALMRRAAGVLRERQEEFARTMSLEMGKLIGEARAEVEKCAGCCEFYAEHGPAYLADSAIATDAQKSLVVYQPLGAVLAIMPWNFPFWQVIRFAAPALVAGNVGLLKHASNVPRCAWQLEEIFIQAGFPPGVFTTLMIAGAQADRVIADPRVHAVTLTGSSDTGRVVAAAAGRALKKTVLELGGSDAFVVLEDVDLDHAVAWALRARLINAGQSCIAAKRFVVVAAIAEAFVARFKHAMEALVPGDPLEPATTLAPLARGDLRDQLHGLVETSLRAGASAVTGCFALDRPGFFYAPSILDHVKPGMPAYAQELFGPVAAVIRAEDEEDALRIANDSPFGLGGSVWTRDVARGERFARRMACGAAFVNGMVKSDPRLPFGGIKESGYGRELSSFGIREFVNVKSLWIGPTGGRVE